MVSVSPMHFQNLLRAEIAPLYTTANPEQVGLKAMDATGTPVWLRKSQNFWNSEASFHHGISLLTGKYASGQGGKTYDARYDSKLLRGTDASSRPWDLMAEIRSRLTPESLMLDIGCGTASRLLPLAPLVRGIVGLEPNPRMLMQAFRNLSGQKRDNVAVFEGECHDLLFQEGTFDVVTAMLAPHVTPEVHRVLKPGGITILEKIGDRDKWALGGRFRHDEQGSRARFSEFQPEELAEIFRREFTQLFSHTVVRNEFWTTYYTLEGLKLLCELTPTIRGFDPVRDMEELESIAMSLMTERGIPLQQNRILIIATK